MRVVGSGERYALLETIRAFAAEQLHAGGEVDVRRGTRTPTTSCVRGRRRRGHPGHGQLEAVRRARDDNANTHAAIQWLTSCARAGDKDALEKALLLCGHLNWFWHIGGQHFTARVVLDRVARARGRCSAEPRSRTRAPGRRDDLHHDRRMGALAGRVDAAGTKMPGPSATRPRQPRG